MKPRGEEGTVLVHVLVTAVIVMIIAAGLMRIVMMRYVAQHRFEDSGQNRRAAEAATAEISAAWAKNGSSCSSPVAEFTYISGPSPGTCSCELRGTGANAIVTDVVVTGSAPNCTLQITAGSD